SSIHSDRTHVTSRTTLSASAPSLLLLSRPRDPRALHSFPTRRSSDLRIFEREALLGVLGAVEDVAGGHVDRQVTGTGRIHGLAGVDLLGGKAPLCRVGVVVLCHGFSCLFRVVEAVL